MYDYTDYLRRSEDVVIPCRPGSDDAVKFEMNLRSQTITWSDLAGHDLYDEGHFKVDAGKRLMLEGVQETDAGIYVCTISKITPSGAVTIIKHVVNLHGTIVTAAATTRLLP